MTFVLDGATVALPLEGVVDLPAEAARLAKDIAKLDAEIAKMTAKFGNGEFVAKAPEEVVDELRERLASESAARQSCARAGAKQWRTGGSAGFQRTQINRGSRGCT